MNKDPFKEYVKQSEPGKRDKGYAVAYCDWTSGDRWVTAIPIFAGYGN